MHVLSTKYLRLTDINTACEGMHIINTHYYQMRCWLTKNKLKTCIFEEMVSIFVNRCKLRMADRKSLFIGRYKVIIQKAWPRTLVDNVLGVCRRIIAATKYIFRHYPTLHTLVVAVFPHFTHRWNTFAWPHHFTKRGGLGP